MTSSEKDLLVRDMLGVIADKWTLSVIDQLESGGGLLRFSRILDAVPGVSQKMLTKTLRQMERDGLVIRHVYAEVPPRVEYELTPLGRTLAEAACGVWLWVEKHFDQVNKARRAFERRNSRA
jgi:DNA-binding HxlR family transcriptional regulator